jgi:hypothetical protein|tara:strand:+ start:431 stop:589 length:159 start_codon:yes stop_codon:yes gene_type:complete
MSETKLKELQREIARLKEIDRQISERVDKEADDEIVVECSLDLDYEFQYQSE